MHPVQAAPRQSSLSIISSALIADAPRAGSAEAKLSGRSAAFCLRDAPRAGSAEAKAEPITQTVNVKMHPVQAAQSEITTCRPMVL